MKQKRWGRKWRRKDDGEGPETLQRAWKLCVRRRSWLRVERKWWEKETALERFSLFMRREKCVAI